MEVTEERRTFDMVIEKLRWLGGSLKSALYFGGLDANSLNRMKATVEELNQIKVSDFIGSWLKMPENNSLLEVWINEILNTYFYHKEVETSNFKPQQLGDDWVMIAENYDVWRNTIIWKLSLYLPDGAAKIYEGKKYVIFPKIVSKVKEQVAINKQKKSFKDCLLVQDKDGLLERLHKYLDVDGRKGKDAAMVIKVCCDNGLIQKPDTSVIIKEFNVGSKQGFDAQWRLRDNFEKERLSIIRGFLRDFI